jgi:hypothetical protein
MYQEVECNCESVAADVWSAHNCDLHGGHVEEERRPECSACGKEADFECTGCNEPFCNAHRIAYDGEEACPDCALFWAQDAVKKMHMAIAKAVYTRLDRRVA